MNEYVTRAFTRWPEFVATASSRVLFDVAAPSVQAATFRLARVSSESTADLSLGLVHKIFQSRIRQTRSQARGLCHLLLAWPRNFRSFSAPAFFLAASLFRQIHTVERLADVAFQLTDPIAKCSGAFELKVFGSLQHLGTQLVDVFFGNVCLLYTSPSPRDRQKSRMPSSA